MGRSKYEMDLKRRARDPFVEVLQNAFVRNGVVGKVSAQAAYLGMSYSTYATKLKKDENGKRRFNDTDYRLMVKKLDLSCEEIGMMLGCKKLKHSNEFLEG